MPGTDTARAVAATLVAATALGLAPGVTRLPSLRRRLPRLNGDSSTAHVALTFDDGPDPASTPAFLDELERLDVHATFFLLGTMVEHSPALAREVVERGHEVGVHGWDHRSLALRGPLATDRQLARGLGSVRRHTGTKPVWWRPPYGVLTGAGLLAARRHELTPVLWGAWGQDWTSRATARSVLATLEADLRPGRTVLLHDSDCTSAPGAWRSALGALPELVARCRARGVGIGPLAEHWLRP